jgi:hypothetical protein
VKGKFRDFGELYNAAFAERDPEKKLNLLSEVRRVIAEWEQVLQAAPPAVGEPSGAKPAMPAA